MSFLKKLIPGHHGKDKHDDQHTTGTHGTHGTHGSHGSHGATTTTTSGAVPSGAVVAEVPLSDGHHHYGPPPHNASATVAHPVTAAGNTVDHHHHHATTAHTTGVATTGVAPAVATTGVAGVAEQKMILSEEKLVVGKREQEVGGVDITKHIERHTESVPVSLTRETVTVERRPIAPGTASYAGASTFGQDQHITATVSAEQAVVGKTIVPVEQVQVAKTRVAETQIVQGAVRTENVEVKRDAIHQPTGAATAAALAPAHAHGHAAGVQPASGPIVNSSGAVTAYEEHLAVGKQRVTTDQVDVHKRVDVAMASAPVRLEHDEVAISRTAVAPGQPVPSALSQGSVHIGVGRETAQVGTVVVPKEEVVIRKAVQTQQQMVSGEVAREKIDVTTTGAVHLDPAHAHAHAQAPAHAHAGAPVPAAHR